MKANESANGKPLSCDSLRLTNLTVKAFSFPQQHVNYTLLFALLLDHFKPKMHANTNKCIDHILCITMNYLSANTCEGPPSL